MSMDHQYQDGQLLYKEIGPVLPSTTRKLLETKIEKPGSELALKHEAKKLDMMD